MLPDRVSNQGPLTYESGALPIALRGPAGFKQNSAQMISMTRQCVGNKNRAARLKVKVAVRT